MLTVEKENSEKTKNHKKYCKSSYKFVINTKGLANFP